MRSLTYRQRLFVESYLGESSKSPVDAARRAGYRWPEKLGPLLVKKSRIQAAIDADVATSAMTSNEVLARLADVAAADVLEFFDSDRRGRAKVDLKLVKRLGLGHLLKRLRMNKDGTPDLELEPKAPALVKLGDYYKLWEGEAEQQITMVDVAKELEARYEKLRKDEESGTTAGELQGPTGPVQ
jgi:Terminase small subunit